MVLASDRFGGGADSEFLSLSVVDQTLSTSASGTNISFTVIENQIDGAVVSGSSINVPEGIYQISSGGGGSLIERVTFRRAGTDIIDIEPFLSSGITFGTSVSSGQTLLVNGQGVDIGGAREVTMFLFIERVGDL